MCGLDKKRFSRVFRFGSSLAHIVLRHLVFILEIIFPSNGNTMPVLVLLHHDVQPFQSYREVQSENPTVKFRPITQTLVAANIVNLKL